MLRPAVNRQPGYRRRGLVELETIPNDSDMIDPRVMSSSKEGSELRSNFGTKTSNLLNRLGSFKNVIDFAGRTLQELKFRVWGSMFRV